MLVLLQCKNAIEILQETTQYNIKHIKNNRDNNKGAYSRKKSRCIEFRQIVRGRGGSFNR